MILGGHLIIVFTAFPGLGHIGRIAIEERALGVEGLENLATALPEPLPSPLLAHLAAYHQADHSQAVVNSGSTGNLHRFPRFNRLTFEPIPVVL